MKVSIVIPCYNAERYLSDAIRSALGQTHKSIEVICVDNGSSDRTVNIVKEFLSQDARVRLLHQPLPGAANARNLGLMQAQGEYIQFLDSDDVISNNKIERQLSSILSRSLDVVVSDRSVFSSDFSRKLLEYKFSEIEDRPLATAVAKIIITGNPLYRKSAILRIGGYNPDLRVAQDWDFHIRLFLDTVNIGYEPGDFLQSRQVACSLSSNWIEVSNSAALVIRALGKQLLINGIHNDRESYEKIASTYLNSAIHGGDTEFRNMCISGIKEWSICFNPLVLVSKPNKFLMRMIGIRGFVLFKRALYRLGLRRVTNTMSAR